MQGSRIRGEDKNRTVEFINDLYPSTGTEEGFNRMDVLGKRFQSANDTTIESINIPGVLYTE